jgi:PEP-CTERM motif
MNGHLVAFLLAAAGLALPSSSLATTLLFDTTLTVDYSGVPQGNVEMPFQLGDKVSARITYDPSVMGRDTSSPSSSRFTFDNKPVTHFDIKVTRSNSTILDASFDQSNQALSGSAITVENRTSMAMRDRVLIVPFYLANSPLSDGWTFDRAPSDVPEMSFYLSFYETCASGSFATGDCIANNPNFDFFESGETPDLSSLFGKSSEFEFVIDYYYNSRYFDLYGDVVNIVEVGSVPEPSSWAMMLSGFGVIGGMIRRHSTSKAARTARAI